MFEGILFEITEQTLFSHPGGVVLERILRNPESEVQAFKLEQDDTVDFDLQLRLELKEMRDTFFNTYIIICSKNNTDRVLRQVCILLLYR